MLPTMPLRIVADRNIALVSEAFASFGEVVALPASELTREAVKDADLLLIRSTVKVGPALLEGSRVRFVATATIGVDHLDLDWLASRKIAWASAPGSNADSVRQWWAAALVELAARERDLSWARLGIVGVGEVGGRIERLWRALGGEPLLCDPPRAEREGRAGFVSLDELLASCELLTLHVPLAPAGPHPTRHLIDAARLARLPEGAWLMNASRGEVVDGAALKDALASGRLGGAILDVFEGEPAPSPSLIDRCALATPHIAGHALDGKVAGTRMIYRAACRFLDVQPTWQPSLPEAPPLTIETSGRTDRAILLEAVRFGYPIADDDAALRQIVALPEAERALAFQRFRAGYRPRRELGAGPLFLRPERPELERVLRALEASVGENKNR